MGAYEKAVDLLKRREHTAKDLMRKLAEKGFNADDINHAVEKLKAEGYLSDERFAEVYLRSRLRKTAEGKPVLIMRLIEKGVPKVLASAMVNAAWDDEEYLPSLIREWNKQSTKYGREKAGQKLLQKGFTLTEIRKAEEKSNEER